jgi:putative transposase
MPWKESSVMSERIKMILEDVDGLRGSKADLARRYGVSRKTVHKWLQRFQQGSWDGLKDRSRAPHFHPNALRPEVVAWILEVKRQHPFWGAPKLRQKLLDRYGEETPAESTVTAVLKRHGLSHPLERRRRATPSTQPLGHAEHPNDVWTVDFKGDFALGDGTRCVPLTVCDACSRYFLEIKGYGRAANSEQVQQAFIPIFRQHGLPQAIRNDNGAPFASHGLGGLTRLSVWWVRLGIRLERIEPAHPEQNGRHERAHRTLKEQTASPSAENLAAQQEAFARFAREFNWERPHEALGQKTPASIYQASARSYPERLPAPREYPSDWLPRRVSPCGRTKWNGLLIPVTLALRGQDIAFQPVGDGLWAVYFEHLRLGTFDERKNRIQPATRLHDRGRIVEDYAI